MCGRTFPCLHDLHIVHLQFQFEEKQIRGGSSSSAKQRYSSIVNLTSDPNLPEISSPTNDDQQSFQDYVIERFPIFFANHTIVIAFTILYAYYEFEVVMCYLHFLFYIMMVFGIYRQSDGMKKIGLIMCYLIDVILIIASMAALSAMKSKVTY